MIRSFQPDPLRRLFCITALLASAATASTASAAATPTPAAEARGVLRLASNDPVDETVAGIKEEARFLD